jgi:adenine-specific DNA-methyltransferase
MEKLSQETVNFTEKNIDRIAALFPSAITETKDADGKLKRAVNFEQLKQLLTDEVVDGDECYEFTWVGKKQSIIEGNRPIRKNLRPCKEESKNWDTTENLYIEGDNLDVLKLLQNSYLNKVKMIYIDPPYNTGNDFIYRDNFKVSKEDYEEELGLFDEEENRLFKNTETNGRYHSDWCSMMYPRLQLARNLLTDDGVIFISIDDNEVHNLRKICDEVFGEENLIAQLVWSAGRKNDSKLISVSHEYLLCYVKSITLLKEQGIIWRERKAGLEDIYKEEKALRKKHGADYVSMTKELKDWYRNLPNGHPAKDHKHYCVLDDRGIYFPSDISWPGGGGPKYEIVNPANGIAARIPSRGWLTKKETMLKWIEQGKVDFGEAGSVPCLKSYLSDREYSVPYSVFYQDGRASSKRIMAMFGAKVFENPKDEEIILRLINFSTSVKNSIILDFFSGSATTAHAVMQLNAEDGGNRKFIMVQLPEETDPKSEAYKAGYKNICEIGKERIRRAGKKIEEELKAKSTKGDLFEGDKEVKMVDTGFRVLKVDSTNMKDVFYSPSQYNQQMLLDLESNIKDDRTDIDLLYGVLLEWGVPLSLPHITEKIGGKDVHFVNDTDLVACFEEHVPEEVIREIARRKPLRVVFRDSSFRNSPDKINVTEIFKTLSPETTIKVI